MFHIGLQWRNETIQYLGLTIPIKPKGNKYELFRLNFDGYCPKLQTILYLWKSRGLILLGKITILKSLIFPKLVFKLSNLCSNVSKINLASSIELEDANMLYLPSFITALHWKFIHAFLVIQLCVCKKILKSFLLVIPHCNAS